MGQAIRIEDDIKAQHLVLLATARHRVSGPALWWGATLDTHGTIAFNSLRSLQLGLRVERVETFIWVSERDLYAKVLTRLW